MYDEQVKNLRICAEGQHCDKCGKWEAKQNGGMNACQESLCTEAADAIEELSRAVDAIPHVCECCIGCEVESGGCDNAFVLSPKRAREYLNKPRWIPVTERLPDAGERVLCYCRANIYEVMKMRTDGDWVHGTNHVYMHSFVTHWMPLPQAPKEE